MTFRQVRQHGRFGAQLRCAVWGAACCSARQRAHPAGLLLLPITEFPCQPVRMEQVWPSIVSALLICAGAFLSFMVRGKWVMPGMM
jgi:hypothetical protein